MTATIFGSPDHALQQNDPSFYPPTMRVCRHLIGFLQWRFSLLPAGSYHWAESEEQSVDRGASEIWISGDTPIPCQTVGFRPAITVLRSQVQFQGIGIGDVIDHRWGSGSKTRTDLIPTTICVNVLSRLPMVAERLAWFVQDQIFGFREEIVRTEKCILSIGQRTSMPPPSPAGSLVDSLEEDWSVVPLFLPAYLQHAVKTTPLNVPVLQKLTTILKNKGEGETP
jgi:hypothetical protein